MARPGALRCAALALSLAAAWSSECVDEHTECPGWAADGECRRNGAWMRTHCVRSCGGCDPLAVRAALLGEGAYSVHVGRLQNPTGRSHRRDYHPLHAAARCNATRACLGFSMQTARRAGASPYGVEVARVEFGFAPSGAAVNETLGWVSFLKRGGGGGGGGWAEAQTAAYHLRAAELLLEEGARGARGAVAHADAAPAECVAAKPSARLVLPDEAVDAAAAKAAEALVARAVDAALLAAGGAPPPPPPRHHQSTPNLADPPQHSSASFARRANSLSSAAYWLARDASAGEAEVLPLLASDAAHALPERGSPAPGARRFAGLPKPQRVEAVEVDEYEDAAHVHDASSLRASAFSRNGPPTRRRRAPPMGCFASLLPGLDLELFAECGEWMFAVKGDMLTQQGDFCSAIYFVVPTGGSVLLELDVGHVAGPVPVLHSGDLGAVVGVASVLGKEPCGYSCVAVEEGAWAFRVSSSAWRRTADLHPAWMLQLQRVALLQEMYNMSRIRSMSRLWLAGGWTGANFDTVTALSDPSPQESAPPKQEQEEHVHSFLPKALQGAVRGIERASKGWLSQLSENEVEDEDGAASRNEWFMSSQARWAHAASRWVSRRRPVGTDLH